MNILKLLQPSDKLTRIVTIVVVVLVSFLSVKTDTVLAQDGPQLVVVVNDDSAHANHWPVGPVTLTIDDPETTIFPDFSMTEFVYVDEESGQTWALLNFEDEGGYDVLPGHIVKLTDGQTIKTHIVTHLGVTDVDLETDLVSGVAEPNGNVYIDVFSMMGPLPSASIHLQADGNGEWRAYFSTIIDINPGDMLLVSEHDYDNDCTLIIHDFPSLIEEINVPLDLAQVNTPIEVSATFSYPSEYPFFSPLGLGRWYC